MNVHEEWFSLSLSFYSNFLSSPLCNRWKYIFFSHEKLFPAHSLDYFIDKFASSLPYRSRLTSALSHHLSLSFTFFPSPSLPSSYLPATLLLFPPSLCQSSSARLVFYCTVQQVMRRRRKMSTDFTHSFIHSFTCWVVCIHTYVSKRAGGRTYWNKLTHLPNSMLNTGLQMKFACYCLHVFLSLSLSLLLRRVMKVSQLLLQPTAAFSLSLSLSVSMFLCLSFFSSSTHSPLTCASATGDLDSRWVTLFMTRNSFPPLHTVYLSLCDVMGTWFLFLSLSLHASRLSRPVTWCLLASLQPHLS